MYTETCTGPLPSSGPYEEHTMTLATAFDTTVLDTTVSDVNAPTRRRNLWALWGIPAGLLGFAASVLTADYGEVDGATSARIIEQLDRGRYHLGIVLGIGAILCLLVAAAGWQRWGMWRAPESLAARLVPLALTASAGALMLGYGFLGALAVYLPGGMDDELHSAEGLYAVFMFLDFAPFIGWWGAAFAATGVAWLALRERALPLWMGIVSALFVIVPVGFMAATGLPGFPGVVDPAWLAIISVGMALRRDR
jgi:hypothetical protein